MNHYMKNRHKKDFIIKTVSADNDYSAGFDKKPKKIKRSLFTKVKRILGWRGVLLTGIRLETSTFTYLLKLLR